MTYNPVPFAGPPSILTSPRVAELDQETLDRCVAAIATMETAIPSLGTFQAEAVAKAVAGVLLGV